MGMTTPAATYEINERWRIVRASEELCRVFRCAEADLIGRDVRDLLREDWRLDFRSYVARALVGVGDYDVTVPMVTPGGEHGWFKHTLEPLSDEGALLGYRATIVPHIVHAAAPAKGWWDSRWPSPHLVWDFDGQSLVDAIQMATPATSAR